MINYLHIESLHYDHFFIVLRTVHLSIGKKNNFWH